MRISNFPSLALAAVLLLPALARAQGDDRKAYIVATLKGDTSAGCYDYDISAVGALGTTSLATDPGSTPHYFNEPVIVTPGKLYSVQVTSNTGGTGTASCSINIQAPPGFTVFVATSEGSGVAPTSQSPILAVNPGSTNSGTTHFNFQLVSNQSLAPAPAGRITELAVGDFVFQLGLGSLDNGRSAGRLEVRSDGGRSSSTYGLPIGLFSYASMSIAAPGSAGVAWSSNTIQTGQVKVVRASITNGYSMSFYSGDGAGGYNSTAYTSYAVEQWTGTMPANAPSSTDCMRITETQGSATIYHYVFRSTSSEDWTLIEGTGSEERIEQHSSTGTNPRYETILIKNSSATTIAKTVRTWANYSGSDQLTQEDVWSNVGGSADLTTSYTYFTSGAGSIGKVDTITHPDGSTTSFTYYDDDARLGQVKTVTEPWGASSTKVTTYDYDGPSSFLKEYTLSAVTAIGGTITAKTTYDYHSFASLSSADSTPRPLVHCTATTYTLGGTTPSTPLTSDTISYMKEDGDYVFTGRPYAVESPDGRQQVFRYEKGTYSGGTFTAGSGSAWRTWIVEGSHTGGSATTSIAGLTFQSIGLVANQSTLTEVVRNSDDTIAYQKSYVWNGSSWDTANPIATTTNAWTDSVRQSSSTALNGVAQSWTWNGALLATATDGTGILRTYSYDTLNRLSSVTKAGVASYDSLPAQYDQAISYAYDAANRVVTETHSGNSLTRSTTHTYDDAGRLKSTTLPDGEATSMAYSFPGSYVTQVVATLPNSATVTTQTYPDGQTKSVTGATDVDQYFSYTVETDGEITSRVDLASSSSSRWKKVKTDCVGRATVTTQPGFTGLSDMVTTNTYDGTTGLLTKISRTGLADEYRTYGYMGQLTTAGLDVGNNGSLAVSDSADRVTDYSDSGFYNDGTNWWALSETKIYPSTSSPTTALPVSYSYTRLTGWSSGLISETSQQDRFGNATGTSMTLDTSKKRVTTWTAYPGVTSDAVSIANNGLQTQATTPDGRTMTNTYDGLGRLYQSVDSRTGTTTYTYKTSGSYALDQVDTATDPASAVTTYAYNSNDGRVKSLQNTAGYSAYYSYDNSGRMTRQWGAAITPVEYTYNSYGQVSEQHTFRSLADGWTSTTWPTSPTADVTTMTYDGPTGLLTQKKDAANNSTDYTYNQQGQVATRLWSRLNGSSARISTTYGYASLTGELTSLTYNDGTPGATYTYDRMGMMLSAADIYNGSSTETRSFEYDSYQRLITEKNSAYLGSRWLTYTYETSGTGLVPGRASGYTVGVSGSLAGDSTSLYAYDSAGRIGSLAATQTGVSGTRTFNYTYASSSSLVTGLSESTTGYSQTRAYETNRDLLNQFTTQFTISSVTTTKSRYDYTFNTLGQRVTAKQSGDAYADLGVPSFYKYDYDSRGEVSDATGFLCVSGSVTNYTLPMPGRAYQFAYDAAGNRTSATCTTNGTLLDYFTSNNLNQYTSRGNHSIPISGTLDSSAKILVNGALADRQGAYWSADVTLSNGSGPAYNGSIPLNVGKAGSPDLKQITSVAGFIAPATENSSYIGYDADGNLMSDGRWTYTWDAENRMTSMQTTTTAISAGLPGKKLDFRYDSNGRRISKKVSTWSGSTWTVASEIRFVYQGWNLVAELDALNSLSRIRTYTWGLDLAGSRTATGGIGALVQFVDNAGTATAYHPGYDGSGNVAAVMKDDGTIVAAYEYGPFGELLRKDGIYAADNPFRNATKYTDNDSGYVYYGTRFYSPNQGRFINRDSIEEQGGVNLYAFVCNDPVNSHDVLGRDAFAGVTWYNTITGEPHWEVLDGMDGLDYYNKYRTIASNTPGVTGNSTNAPSLTNEFGENYDGSSTVGGSADWKWSGGWDWSISGGGDVPEGFVHVGTPISEGDPGWASDSPSPRTVNASGDDGQAPSYDDLMKNFQAHETPLNQTTPIAKQDLLNLLQSNADLKKALQDTAKRQIRISYGAVYRRESGFVIAWDPVKKQMHIGAVYFGKEYATDPSGHNPTAQISFDPGIEWAAENGWEVLAGVHSHPDDRSFLISDADRAVHDFNNFWGLVLLQGTDGTHGTLIDPDGGGKSNIKW